ncbi:MAG: zinc-ribbon domain-containing protein [Pseudomonadota bacterium]
MIITCQNCQKRYQVDDKDIGEKGRKVRCDSCKHVWTQIPDQPVTKRTEIRHLAGSNPKIFPEKRPNSFSFGWASLVVCLLITVGSLWGARQTIVSSWPATRPLYQALGISLPLPGQGLILEGGTPMHVLENDSSYIVVRGEITNKTDDVIPLPPLHFQLIGSCKQAPWWQKAWGYLHDSTVGNHKQTCTLAHWRHSLSQKRLLAGEKIQFESEPHTTMANADQIKVHF